jgi:hypothetical protein
MRTLVQTIVAGKGFEAATGFTELKERNRQDDRTNSPDTMTGFKGFTGWGDEAGIFTRIARIGANGNSIRGNS